MARFQELGHPTNEFSSLEFRDDGRYEICCSRGHKSVTVLQQQKFEVLFDIGANAVLDGYYREADCGDKISAVTFEHIRACSKLAEGQVSGGTMCVNTIVSLTYGEEKNNSQTLEEALSGVSKWRDIVTSAEGITKLYQIDMPTLSFGKHYTQWCYVYKKINIEC